MTRRHKWICAERDVRATQRGCRGWLALRYSAVMLMILPGCALLTTGSFSERASTQSQRVSQLEKMLKQKQSAIEEMRERNLVLEQRLRKTPRVLAAAPITTARDVKVNLAPGSMTSVVTSLRGIANSSRRGELIRSSPRISSRSRQKSSSLEAFGRSSLNADEIVPVPFTPSAASGFDLDQTKALQSAPGVDRGMDSMNPEVAHINASVDLRARQVAVESSPNVAIVQAHAEHDFEPLASLNEVSAHTPGVGTDDLSFALRISKKPATPLVKSTSPADEIFAANSGSSGEHYLYSKVVNSYREHKIAELTKSTHLLLKSYPDSVFADNAIYLNGLLSFEMSEYAHAEQYMNQVIREFPQGNKVVGAIFAKAMIAKKMKKYSQSESILQQVARTFPGSPEAGRVNYEIKLLKVAQAGRIREL